MKIMTCKVCGGSMVMRAHSMTAVCNYCGNEYILSREDTDYYRDFFVSMSRFLSGDEDEQARRLRADEFWENAMTKSFECDDDNVVEIKYMYKYSERDCVVYVARRNIVIHFEKNGALLTEQFRRTVSFLDYPSADVRGLSKYFPKVNGGFKLYDGSYILVISKDEDEYPLRLFGTLSPRHTAWVISRLENLCCVLEYNGLVHPSVNPDTVYINPYEHQASLLGNWQNVGRADTARADGGILRSSENLIGLRNTAAQLLGFRTADDVRPCGDIPKALADFITSVPRSDAYEDFGYWDEMLIKAFGERRFVKMDTEDEKIYN